MAHPEQQGELGFARGRDEPSRERKRRRLAALMAPAAADAGAPIRDPELLVAAQAVCEVFAESPSPGGLTKAEILDRADGRVEREVLAQRTEVFERLGWLRPYLDKRHQQRYTLDPAGLAGQQVFARICERGGVDELLALLDRTRSLLGRRPSRAALCEHLHRLRELFVVYAADLERLVATAPLGELLAERDDHDRATAFAHIGDLAGEVTARFPDLRPLAARLVEDAHRYLRAVEALVARVLDEGGRSRDFSVLPADDYLDLAIDGTVEELAAVLETVVFDPPSPWVSADELLAAAGHHGRARPARRPPPPPPDARPDPVAALVERTHRGARRRALRAEQLLDGEAATEVTSTLRGLRWPAAAAMLADLLALDLDHAQPYRIRIGEATFVDRDAEVTYSSPVTLRTDRTLPVDAQHTGECAGAEAISPGGAHA